MTNTTNEHVRIDVRVAPESTESEIAVLRRKLTQATPTLSPKYFYDDRGSELFERISALPEYYQTRTEKALLAKYADEIVALTGAEELVELGSGAANKTRVLLDAMRRANTLTQFVPFDVSEGILRRTAEELTEEYPGLYVHGIVGDFLRDLGSIPEAGRRLVVFLGGTIGNMRPEPDARLFLEQIAASMNSGDYFLLGTDLIKDASLLKAAYDDSQGVTAEFNRNILRVVNDRFGANFEPRCFRHRAVWNEEERRIEMWLVASEAQEVFVADADLHLSFREGDALLTEISTKYDRERVESLLQSSGFELEHWLPDSEGLFSLSLARRR